MTHIGSHVGRRLGSIVFVWGLASAAGPSHAEAQGVAQAVAALEERLAAVTEQVNLLRPLNLTVDCGAGQSVGAALAQAGFRASRVTLTIAGVCTEEVVITRNNTVLRAAAPGAGLQAPTPTANVLRIGARDVQVNGLALAGGTGVIVGRRSSVVIANSQLTGSSFHGVAIFGADVEINNSTIAGSAVLGIQAMSGSRLALVNTRLQGNRFGLDIANGSFALLDGNTQVDGQGSGSGVSVSFNSTLHVGRAEVKGSNGDGVMLAGGSAAHFGFGGGLSVISGNAGNGLRLGDTSVASDRGEGGSVDILNNGGYGVWCAGSPAVAQLAGPIANVAGNALGQVSCPISQ